MRDFAATVDRLEGRYITAEDVGTTQDDMDLIHETTPFVAGTSTSRGGSGDPSPATALGVVVAMEAAAARRWGTGLEGRTVLVLGAGKVGGEVIRLLVQRRAVVIASDLDHDKVEKAGTRRCRPHRRSLRCRRDTRRHPLPVCVGWTPHARRRGRSQLSRSSWAGRTISWPRPEWPRCWRRRAFCTSPTSWPTPVASSTSPRKRTATTGHARVEAVDRIRDTTTTVLERAEARGITPVAAAEELVAERLDGASDRMRSPTHTEGR